jgi:signal transduction histidine kinase/DNA-binding response OmpR family regulator
MMIRKGQEEILIVEDSPTQMERLRFILEKHGFRVVTAPDGREATRLLARIKPVLVISDILMPEVDGYQLCRFIRQDQNLQNIPVILLTALSDPVDVLRALECGADNFIIKPFEEENLIQRVELFLLNQSLRRHEGVQVGLEIVFQGQKYFINSDRLQILNLLLSTYEAAVERNGQLLQAQGELQAQREELQVQNDGLKGLTEELRQSKGRAQRQAQILAGINRIFHEAMTCTTEEELGRTCLAAAEELTGSKFGFICELNPDGLLDNISISDPGWAECQMSQLAKVGLPKGLHIHGLFGKAVKEGKAIIANDPATHPDRVGIPEGHAPLTAFLGVPLKHAGRTIGMIGLGNKPGGYDLSDQAATEALAPAIVESFLRKRAEARVTELNQDLLRHVLQLEAANQELEAFSYSVSHDLRAPLRGIMGFSRMLQEEYGAKLDDQALRYLEMLQKASIQMNELIEALLGLSRVSRAEIRRQPVDLSALARSIAENLQRAEPERSVDFFIADGVSATGDLNLLKIMMENLLSNAWKFTRKTPAARIEFGVQEQGFKRVFFIRDNGVGFNMEYAKKLFGAFQRLHTQEEFPGTGIGLATVQRIIKRHGGRIWAEGTVDQGAAFYFSFNPQISATELRTFTE